MNTQIPMTYNDYFGSGNYANSALPNIGTLKMEIVVTQQNITDVLNNPSNALNTIGSNTIITSQVQSLLTAITQPDEIFPPAIISAIKTDINTKLFAAIMVLNTMPPITPILLANYLTGLLDAKNNYNLVLGASQTSVPINLAFAPATDLTITLTTSITFGGLRKFVDPIMTPPIAVPDTQRYSGSDYYEIGLVEFQHKFHSDLPMTKVRGYVQLNNPADPAVFDMNGIPTYIPAATYGGPAIMSTKNVPVRIKFFNLLPVGHGGDLFLPVDTTLIGTGNPDALFTQNRATLHLNGGNVPWISDGNPNQWITPANEKTPYPQGVSVTNVPDMDQPAPGTMTFYYSNQQSARLLFYHDSSYGITRLNVYAGELATYNVRDSVEQDLINRGVLPSDADTITLSIQDKTFVPPKQQIDLQDPTWSKGIALGLGWGSEGQLWYPHVYSPNQNPNINSAANDYGRWDYGPWFWPPYVGLLYDPAAEVTNGTVKTFPSIPNPSIVPTSYMDTPIINGVAYPYMEVQKKTYRFKIVNTANSRAFNLQLHKAVSNTSTKTILKDGSVGDLHLNSGEVNMVQANFNTPNWPATWPGDGRVGGVPDPNFVGPSMVQIANESGFITAPVVYDNEPVGYEYNRRNIVVMNISTHNVLLGSGERADVLVDFSTLNDGDIVILYNDAPAPNPTFDPRNDYYTGNPDTTSSGGAPSTIAGYGPNTRTIMQFRVMSGAPAAPLNIATLTTELANAYYASQLPPIVPEPQFAQIYGGKLGDQSLYVDNLIWVENDYFSFKNINVSATAQAIVSNGSVNQIILTSNGGDYVPSTTMVKIDPPAVGTAATAEAIFSSGNINSLTLTNAGANYHLAAVTVSGNVNGTPVTLSTTAQIDTIIGNIISIKPLNGLTVFDAVPVVTIDPPNIGNHIALAITNIDGTVFTIIDSGAGYTPNVVFNDGFGAGVIANAVWNGDGVVGVTVHDHGYGYWTPVNVMFDPPTTQGGMQAMGTVNISRGQIISVTMTSMGSGYTAAPNVTFMPVPDSPAVATAVVSNGYVDTVTVVNGGENYYTPFITVSAPDLPGGRTAILVANSSNGVITDIMIVDPGMGYSVQPTVQITDPNQTGVLAVLDVKMSFAGSIAGLNLLTSGSGYSTDATVTIIGSSLTSGINAATATCVVSYKNSINSINITNNGTGYTTPPTVTIIDNLGMYYTYFMKPKAIQELFTMDYGRMNFTFGAELPLTTQTTQTTIPLGYCDPPTEIITASQMSLGPVRGDGTQIWKITHNGVYTHSVHFPMCDVQLINRVGWDGMLANPEPHECGWKETFRMDPLQVVMVAIRPVAPGLPFGVTDSMRLNDVNMPAGATSNIVFINVDPTTGAGVTTVNTNTNFAWEYTLKAQNLEYQEIDMMRPYVLQVDKVLPDPLFINVNQPSITQVVISWINNPMAEYLTYNPKGIVGIIVERGLNGVYTTLATIGSSATMYIDDSTTSYNPFTPLTSYTYRVTAFNAAGGLASNVVQFTTK